MELNRRRIMFAFVVLLIIGLKMMLRYVRVDSRPSISTSTSTVTCPSPTAKTKKLPKIITSTDFETLVKCSAYLKIVDPSKKSGFRYFRLSLEQVDWDNYSGLSLYLMFDLAIVAISREPKSDKAETLVVETLFPSRVGLNQLKCMTPTWQANQIVFGDGKSHFACKRLSFRCLSLDEHSNHVLDLVFKHLEFEILPNNSAAIEDHKLNKFLTPIKLCSSSDAEDSDN